MLALGTSHRPNTSYLDNQVTNLSLQFLGIGLHGHLVSLPHLPKHILHLPRPPHLVSRQDDHTLIVVHPVHTLGGGQRCTDPSFMLHSMCHILYTAHYTAHSQYVTQHIIQDVKQHGTQHITQHIHSMLHSAYTGC